MPLCMVLLHKSSTTNPNKFNLSLILIVKNLAAVGTTSKNPVYASDALGRQPYRQCPVAFSLRSVANYQRKPSKIFWAVQVINPSEEMVKNSFYSLNNLFDYYMVASSLASVGSKLLNAI